MNALVENVGNLGVRKQDPKQEPTGIIYVRKCQQFAYIKIRTFC